MMVPSRVIRATVFLEDKITRKDLYYGKVETVTASKASLCCGIGRRPEGIIGTAHPVSFQLLHTSLFPIFHLFFALLNSHLRGLGLAPRLS